MTTAEFMLAQDYLRYQKMLQALEAEALQLPKGTLVYRFVGEHQYCHLQFRDAQGVHNQRVSKEEEEQTQQALQRRKELKSEIQDFQQYIKKLEKAFPQLPSIAATLSPQNIPIPNTSIPNPKKPYRTAKGEFVRSKSELIIANELYANQISYEYEKPLTLQGCRYDVYPDFTIETPHQKQVVYWEHCGLMNDPSYRDKWEWKKQAYERNGICDWKNNLIITYESETGDFNTDMIRQNALNLLQR